MDIQPRLPTTAGEFLRWNEWRAGKRSGSEDSSWGKPWMIEAPAEPAHPPGLAASLDIGRACAGISPAPRPSSPAAQHTRDRP